MTNPNAATVNFGAENESTPRSTSQKNRWKSSLRNFLVQPITFLFMGYAASLTCSMAGMEIGGWSLALFFLIFVILDRGCKTRIVEFHTLGAEFPLLILITVSILGLLLNAPQVPFIPAIGDLRNLALLFFIAYALQVTKSLNKVFMTLLVCATLVSAVGIWQHFTGIDFIRNSNRALVQIPWGDQSVWASVGFFSHHLTYGHSFMMILCLPWAALLLGRSLKWWQMALLLISFSSILTSLVFTYGRGVWLSIFISLPLMALFASKRFFIATLMFVLFVGGGFYFFNPLVQERAKTIFANNYYSNEERKKLWQANAAMFQDHPWIGVGYEQNEPLSEAYFGKLKIKDGMVGHAHSNYIGFLSSTGVLGLTSYMIFIMAFVLMTSRLYSTIPKSHYWHRVFALSALGAQVAFHVGGLTQWNFGDAEVQHQFLFWLAVVAYMSQRYYAHIVPDDYSL